MRITFKFIGIDKLKGETEEEVNETDTMIEILKRIKTNYTLLPSLELISLMYKAKKLDLLKTVKELNIVDGGKINLTKGSFNQLVSNYLNNGQSSTTADNDIIAYSNNNNNLNKQIPLEHESIRLLHIREKAFKELIRLGYEENMINKLLDSTNKTYLLTSPEVVVEKCLIILKSLVKDSYIPDEYSLNIEYLKSEEIPGLDQNVFMTSSKQLCSEIEDNLNKNKDKGNSNKIITNNTNMPFFLDESEISNLYCSGNGINGQLGVSSFIKSSRIMRINFFQKTKVKAIACGLNVSLALDYNGYTYSWGKIFYPYAMNSITEKVEYKSGDVHTPKLQETLTNEVIVNIGCGDNHYLAINDKGQVFSWGEGIYGQLGHGKLDNELYPRLVDTLDKIRIKIILGSSTHSLALSTDNVLFGWGNNEKNQLNFGNYKVVLIPYVIPIFKNLNCFTVSQIIDSKLDPSNFSSKSTDVLFRNEATYIKPIFIDDNDEVNCELSELSNDFSELTTVNLITTGMWFTALTSISQNDIFLFGNNFKKIVKIDYFTKKNMTIDKIEAQGNELIILTCNKLFKIDVNKTITFDNPKQVYIAHSISNIDKDKSSSEHLERISDVNLGSNYILVKSENNWYHAQSVSNVVDNNSNSNSNYNYYSSLNNISSEIPFHISQVVSASTHYLILTSAIKNDFGLFLFEEKVKKALNLNNTSTETLMIKEDITKQFDFGIYSKQSDVYIPCNSFILSRVLDIKQEKIDSDNCIEVDLLGDEVLILLELLYTNSLEILYSLEIIHKVNQIKDLINNLKKISYYLNSLNTQEYSKKEENKNKLIELIHYYIKKLQAILGMDIYSKATEQGILKVKLLETYNVFTNKGVEDSLIKNMSLLKKLSNNNRNTNRNNINNNEDFDEENEEEDHDEDDFNAFNLNRNNDRDYFSQFTTSGVAINLLRSDVDGEIGIKNNIDKYLANKNNIDSRYSFNNSIVSLQREMKSLFIQHLKQEIKQSNIIEGCCSISITKEGKKVNEYFFNKSFLDFYLQLFCQSNMINFDIDVDDCFEFLNIDSKDSHLVLDKSIDKVFDLIRLKEVSFNLGESLIALSISKYLQINNLIIQIELALHTLINEMNILTLLEISDNYNLEYLRHSVLIFVIKNFDVVKNKVELRGLSQKNKEELRVLKALN